MYKFGTIVLIPFPFTDLSSTKLRPALIISKTNQKNQDIIVVFITSKISEKQELAHFILKTSDKHFSLTGLKTDSLFRFDKIATLNKKLILGELGVIDKNLIKKMRLAFYSVFGF